LKKILVVGCGFSGSTIARYLGENGYQVTAIDKRNHVAGNAYDEENEQGIRIHKYGPHIFHTSNKKVFDWLSRFTEWVEYKHKVKGILEEGELVTIPPNLDTVKRLGKQGVLDTIYRPYTKKMWNVDLEELDPSIRKRTAVRDDLNEYYFPDDTYQFMPKDGYSALVDNMLRHKNIEVELNTTFDKSLENDYVQVFNSMPIDEYYENIYGELPYRSIRFHSVLLPIPSLLPAPVINFTHNLPYTRITEWKKFPNSQNSSKDWSVLTYEEPCDYKENDNERFYPVKDINGQNRERYKKYTEIENTKTTFVGRCGQYVYLDMDQAVSSALATAKKFAD